MKISVGKHLTYVTIKTFRICHNKNVSHFVGIHNIMVTVLVQNDFLTPARTFIDNTVPSMEINNNSLVFTEDTLKTRNFPQPTKDQTLHLLFYIIPQVILFVYFYLA